MKHLTLPCIPLRNMVGFPKIIFPFIVGRPKSIFALNSIEKKRELIFLSAQMDGEKEEPLTKDIESVGIIAKIINIKTDPDGTARVLVKAYERAKIKRFVKMEPYFLVEVEEIPLVGSINNNIKALSKEIIDTFNGIVKLLGNQNIDFDFLKTESDPLNLCFSIAFQIPFPYKEKQKILNIPALKGFLTELLKKVIEEHEIIKLQHKIRENVRKKLDDTQKRIILSQELEAIKRELTDIEGGQNEIAEIKEKIEKSGMPEYAMQKALKEVEKLEYTPNYSPEYTVLLNYLDWVISIPWNKNTKDNKDIKKAWAILEKDHWGLEKIKERIIEILSVRQLSKTKKGPVLCFVGPPGVGKTSLGKSIARAMDRKFVRISLGGVRDEAEIRGHRRTYIGALPGKIIQTMKKAGVKNPVFLMDEIDKLSSDFRGDPSSALLEVLDPEQNFMFDDHYLDIEYDLSEVFFITTANNIYNVPDALRDRMEIIFLSGYTSLEKYHIAKNYLIPRQISENGLKSTNIKFLKSGINEIINHYSHEAGVRNLERQIGKVCRKVATKIVENNRKQKATEIIKKENVSEFLGVQEYQSSPIIKQSIRGIANGLAWTRYGGVHLSIESMLYEGSGKIQITGQIGKVMQESVQIAFSLIKSAKKKLKIENEKFKKYDIHVHIPEGAIPKDGPSAGITLATSMLSTFIGKPVKWDTAMTGELTLTGRVLGIGGLKEKLLAAMRIGVKDVIIPKSNVKNLEEIPEDIKGKLNIIPVETIWDVWKIVFDI